MGKKRNTYIALLLSTFALGQFTQAVSLPVAAAAAAKPAATAAAVTAFKPVTVAAGVSAVLEEVNLWPQTGGNIVTFTLRYNNSGAAAANLLHYFPRLITPGGSVLPANPVSADAAKKKINGKNSLSVTYYVNAGQLASLKGVKVSLNVWDRSAKGYLRQAGSFALSANYSAATAAGKSVSTAINGNTVAASAESLQLYKYSGKVYARVGLNLTNKGSQALADPGYRAYLVTASGTSFELALSSSLTGYKVQPQEKKSLYYLAEIPSYVNTSNMKLQLTQADEALKLELPKLSFKLPAASAPDLVVKEGAGKVLSIGGSAVEARLQGASVYAENAQAEWSFNIKLSNKGGKAVTLPTYELAVKSANGTLFPVEAKALSGLTLKPLESKTVPLTVQVPLEVQQEGLQLQMIEAAQAATSGAAPADGEESTVNSGGAATKVIFPVAYFAIPYTLRSETYSGQIYTAENQYGSFSYTLDSLQRYPWKDQDIVIARLKLTNHQSVNLSLPELKGAIKLDNDDLSASTDLVMNKEDAVLAPGQTADIAIYTKVPYTRTFGKASIQLYSTANETKVPFLTLSTGNTLQALPVIAAGGTYTLEGNSQTAAVQENRTTVYEGGSYNIMYTELLVSSNERRQSTPGRLQGYYITAAGDYYEAAASQPDSPALPGGKQLVTFWAKVPKTVKSGELSLILGTGLNGGKISAGEETPTAFFNVASLGLNPKAPTPAANLNAIQFYPYTLVVLASDARMLEGSETMNITLNYTLQRDEAYEAKASEHKLVLRLTDPFGQSQEKTLTPGTDLNEGANNSLTFSFTKSLYKNLRGGTYRITLLDEFQGLRQELGSQTYNLVYEPLPVKEDPKENTESKDK
ncbi:hypothetical protein [Paenibacillus tengchongensis]|uniref:hypothetical protein n=1 Tax=Paenibacillus tengchongensis TaxID=2608684 RepID=UPI00124E007D|nr:hypothetical protein [Paenibacillus tengchongensis]